MRNELKELWRYRELLLTFVLRDLRVRYKNSVLGFFWSLLNPLATVLVMTVVFEYVLGFPTPNYSAYLLAAYLPWTFFQLTLLDSSQTVLFHMPLIKKIYFPREILPLSAVIANLVHFLLALAVFFVYLGVVWVMHPGQSPFTWRIAFLPVIMIGNLALVTGLALFLSAWNAFYEDVKYMLAVGLYLMLFLCPIMYFSDQIANIQALSPQNRRVVYVAYHLNPIATYLTAYRQALLCPQGVVVRRGASTEVMPAHPLEPWLIGVAFGTSFLTLWGGYAHFNRKKWEFVERP